MFPRLREKPRMACGRPVGPSRRIAALALCATALALAACGSGSPSSSPSTSAGRTSTSTTKMPTGAAAQALSAYRSMWSDMVTASQTSDYQLPSLASHASGDALAVLVHDLAKNQQAGLVTKGRLKLDPQVTSLTPPANPNQVTISDCVNDTHWLNYKSTGGLADKTPGALHATTALVVNESGTWKVTELALQAGDTC
jgi:hypothetical protein